MLVLCTPLVPSARCRKLPCPIAFLAVSDWRGFTKVEFDHFLALFPVERRPVGDSALDHVSVLRVLDAIELFALLTEDVLQPVD